MNRSSTFFVGALTALAFVFGGGCATPTALPTTTQPALSTMVQPYGDELRKAGITSVQLLGGGACVRTATNFGEIYTRYPAGLGATVFAVYVDSAAVEVDSDAYTTGDGSRYQAAINAILPAVIKAANENNTRVITNRFGKN